jgi:hypothetical protein
MLSVGSLANIVARRPPSDVLGRLLSPTINRALDYRRGHF